MGFDIKMTFEDYHTFQMALCVFEKHCEEMIKVYEKIESANYLKEDYMKYISNIKKLKNKGE